jgi:hypothetical protein
VIRPEGLGGANRRLLAGKFDVFQVIEIKELFWRGTDFGRIHHPARGESHFCQTSLY